MATESLQEQGGPTDEQECPIQRDVDASLDSAALEPELPRAGPEEDTEVVQGRGQTEEISTECVQDEKPDELKKLIGQGAFLEPEPKEDFSSLEVEISEWSSDDDISSPECHQNLQQLSRCEDSSLVSDFSLRTSRSISHPLPLDVSSPPFADVEEETNMCASKSSPGSHPTHPKSNAISLDGQQGGVLGQGQQELTPNRVKQETAQQVPGQNSAPLSGVAMEPANRGGAAFKGSVCVVTVRESLTDGEGESETGAQNHSGPGGDEVVGQKQGEGPVRVSEFIHVEEEKRGNKGIAECSNPVRMENDSAEDSQSDSGLSADFSPRNTADVTAASQETLPKETPIEREIRRAIEREHSLRRSRGLPNASAEYVEIPLMKAVLNQTVVDKSEKFHGIDRELAGKMMQHEIHAEVGREQDLVKMGKVPGFYDKGTVRKLKEKKQLFEAFQNHRSESPLSVSSGSSSSAGSTSESRDETSSQASTVRSSEGRPSTEQLRGPRGPGLSEGLSCQVLILEKDPSAPGQKHLHTAAEVDGLVGLDPEALDVLSSVSGGHHFELEAEEMSPKENPFFKLRSLADGVKVEKDIREAQEREQELRKQRSNLYGDAGGGGGSGGGRPVGVDRRSLRASGLNSPGSLSSSGSGHSADCQSVGKLSAWPPGRDHGDAEDRPKVVHSSRHKTPLVHLWESGRVNGHNPQE
ncbi:uncharacterized protein misp3 [Syngnathoides biaculeatus]|uniref:uncharacterized protein misp3 n=1 Tax=Syngnathoides biaculeatus TaxID=300417 RepID=UPI002ADE3543|nr:uncharacterized protein misp3 [Syngnathoides biaculeatus]XP_061687098.1 uncharacterized protein misp3 [Syngnathoides biaculeatus]